MNLGLINSPSVPSADMDPTGSTNHVKVGDYPLGSGYTDTKTTPARWHRAVIHIPNSSIEHSKGGVLKAVNPNLDGQIVPIRHTESGMQVTPLPVQLFSTGLQTRPTGETMRVDLLLLNAEDSFIFVPDDEERLLLPVTSRVFPAAHDRCPTGKGPPRRDHEA